MRRKMLPALALFLAVCLAGCGEGPVPKDAGREPDSGGHEILSESSESSESAGQVVSGQSGVTESSSKSETEEEKSVSGAGTVSVASGQSGNFTGDAGGGWEGTGNSSMIAPEDEEYYDETGEEYPYPEEVTQDPIAALGAEPFSGEPYTVINDNKPYFSMAEKSVKGGTVSYGGQDLTGRCRSAYARIIPNMLAKGGNEGEPDSHPSGWQDVVYDGKDLYVPCRLIGWQLDDSGWDDKNFITGTNYMKQWGIEPFERQVAEHVSETKHQVLYRATSLYAGNDLVPMAVTLEAECQECDELSFNVLCYNVQPGVEIDYLTGASHREGEERTDADYIVDEKNKVYHIPNCVVLTGVTERKWVAGTPESLEAAGYSPCETCIVP